MNKNQIKEKLLNILGKVSKIDKSKITENTKLINDLEIDSLIAMELISIVEKEFKIDLQDANIFELETVGDFIALMEARVSK